MPEEDFGVTLEIGFGGRKGTQDDLKTGCVLDTFLWFSILVLLVDSFPFCNSL